MRNGKMKIRVAEALNKYTFACPDWQHRTCTFFMMKHIAQGSWIRAAPAARRRNENLRNREGSVRIVLIDVRQTRRLADGRV